MKYILSLNLSLLFIVSTIYSQECPSCCTNRKIISPIVDKPNESQVVSTTCSSLVIQWTGNPNQSYIVIGAYLDPNTQLRSETAPIPVGACVACTATIPVIAGTFVSWSVQAVQVIDNTTFYSYAFRSPEEHPIPACNASGSGTIQARVNNLLPETSDGNFNGEMYPNPVHSTLTINLSSTSENIISKQGIIRVFDLNGRTVMVQKTTLGTMQVNVASLSSGTYILRINDTSGKALYTTKFIKL